MHLVRQRLFWRWLLAVILLTASFGLFSLHAQSKREPASRQSRPLYVNLEQALDTLSHAEIAREEAALAGNQPTALDQARQQCRTAIKQMLKLDTQVDQLLRTTYTIRPSQRKHTWTIKELESLVRNLKVQIARGYRNQALCYPDGSIDRINSLSLALKQVNEVTRQPLADASVWQARVEQAACLRFNNNTNQAAKLLAQWQTESPPANIASRLLGEQIRLSLSTSDIESALALSKTAEAQATIVPETAEAMLLTLLASQKFAEPTQTVEILRRAQTQVGNIAKQHGHYWQRRAESHLGHAMLTMLDSQDPTLLRLSLIHISEPTRPY